MRRHFPLPPLPDTLLVENPSVLTAPILPEPSSPVPGPTFDASTLPEKQREQFHRNLRAVEQVLAGAPQTQVATESRISRSWLSHLVQRTREKGQIACVPHGSYTRKTTMHPAFQALCHVSWNFAQSSKQEIPASSEKYRSSKGPGGAFPWEVSCF
jgi:hypothetical protein